MKKLTIIFIFFIQWNVWSQNSVESFIREGIELHDAGKYEEAIGVYLKGLEVDSKSEALHYELSMTYMSLKEYKKAIKHADFVIEKDKNHVLEAYITKGSCLDYVGKQDEAIKLLKKGIKKFGDHHLLHYNLALTYVNNNNSVDAEKHLIEAIQAKPSHGSSHLLLARIQEFNGNKIQALLGFSYFLLLESNTSRSQIASSALYEMLVPKPVESDGDKKQITINLSPSSLESEFSSAELMLGILSAAEITDGQIKRTNEDIFRDNLQSIYKIIGEMKKDKNKGIYWNLYAPVFYEIAKSDHMTAYSMYILRSTNENANKWINDNPTQLDAFSVWIKKQ